MANLKDIRDRIGSVKNTRKITEAMRLVAAAKVRRAQEQVLRSRPFADRLARVLENLQSRMRFEDADAPLLEQREVGTITLLAITGDRGLCGGYNANIIKRTELRTAELVGQGYKVDLVLIGRKAITYFQNRANRQRSAGGISLRQHRSCRDHLHQVHQPGEHQTRDSDPAAPRSPGHCYP